MKALNLGWSVSEVPGKAKVWGGLASESYWRLRLRYFSKKEHSKSNQL